MKILSGGHSGPTESLDDVRINAPSHGAHETIRRRRRERRADPQQLRNERRIAGNPVAHHHAATRLGHSDHLLGNVERQGREHRAKHGDGQVERVIGDSF